MTNLEEHREREFNCISTYRNVFERLWTRMICFAVGSLQSLHLTKELQDNERHRYSVESDNTEGVFGQCLPVFLLLAPSNHFAPLQYLSYFPLHSVVELSYFTDKEKKA